MIDSRCPHWNKLAKEQKKDSRKNKSINSAFADILNEKQSSSTFTNKTFSAHPKKNYKQHGDSRHGQEQRRGQGSAITGINIISKKEEKDISYVKYFNCKKKGHYAN